jgi:murein DD-endopeptidase MepM/ murein hydrolase activator NlpD
MTPSIRTTLLSLAVLIPLLAGPAAAQPSSVTVRVLPDPVYVERSGDRQFLSFDLELLDGGQAPLDLVDMRVRGFDKDGQLLVWEKLDSNGSRPAVEVLGPHHLEPGKPLTVFNPFFELDTAVPITLLRFELRFSGPNGLREKASAEVRPQVFAQKSMLILPVAGARLWAYEAPGFYSHHRRLDLNDPFNRDVMKMRRNSQRYALDLVVVDEQGEAFHGDPGKQENWVGLGVPIVAPAPGTVVAAVGDKPDDIPYDPAAAQKEPSLMAGNYVIIDHGNGEYSMLAHFRHGSLAVKAGDHVERGQLLAKMGHSGMGSGLVHVHYELRNSPDLFDGDGLPAVFQGFRRVGSPAPEPGRIAPGWIVITDALPPTAPPPSPAPAPGRPGR